MSQIHCRECGKKISETADSCPSCGARQGGSSRGSSSLSRTTAAWYALLLGGAGVHKFYVGDSKKGMMYLLFFWTFVPAILAFIDAIKLFGMSDSDFNSYVRSIKK